MYDYLIIGAGIIGLAIAKSLNEKYPDKKIIIIEKESDVGFIVVVEIVEYYMRDFIIQLIL